MGLPQLLPATSPERSWLPGLQLMGSHSTLRVLSAKYRKDFEWVEYRQAVMYRITGFVFTLTLCRLKQVENYSKHINAFVTQSWIVAFTCQVICDFVGWWTLGNSNLSHILQVLFISLRVCILDVLSTIIAKGQILARIIYWYDSVRLHSWQR